MATAKKTVAREATAGAIIQGRSVAQLGRGLVQKIARALSRPGTDRSVMFSGPNAAKIFSYAVDQQGPTMVVRKDADGSRATGRLVDGKFRAAKA